MNQKLSAFLIAVLVCVIVWFVGLQIFNVANLETSMSPSSYQELLAFIEVAFITIYGSLQIRHFRRQKKLPANILKGVDELKNAGQQFGREIEKIGITELSTESVQEETIVSSPLDSEEPLEVAHAGLGQSPSMFVRDLSKKPDEKPNNGDNGDSLVSKVLTLLGKNIEAKDEEDMRKRVTIKRLELKEAVYEKLTQDVRSGAVTIKTAEDILAANEPETAPATLETRLAVPKPDVKKEEKPKTITKVPLR